MTSDVVRWTESDNRCNNSRRPIACLLTTSFGSSEVAASTISRSPSGRSKFLNCDCISCSSRVGTDGCALSFCNKNNMRRSNKGDSLTTRQDTTILTSTPETKTTISTKTTTNTATTKINDNNQTHPYSHRFSVIKKILVIMSIFRGNCNYRAFCKFLAFFIVILQLNVILSNFIVIVVADELFLNNDINNSISDNFNYIVNNVRASPLTRLEDNEGHFTSTWAVHIPNGDNGIADQVAEDHGFINMGKIFDDHYHFHHKSVQKRSIEPSHHHQQRLAEDDRVHWSKQQEAKSRQKRDFMRMRPSRTSAQTISLAGSIQLNDPKWPQMWYLNRGNGLDMNVIPAWKEGITGKGVVVTILDDGLESDHPDLEHNYDPKASYDVNSHDEDPMPHYDMTDSNRHGTRCAGEVAATANNSMCAVGIAFGASVGGVRMLDGDVTDAVEARSLSLNPQHIDIYSASWGPDDDGKTVDGPGELATRAFIEGVTKGRNGKGSIFIWASGNGGREQDNCNCDGYTNSIWTLSISSATEEGHVPWYSEKCSSTLATTYSSGGVNEKQVVTTDLHHSCTISHTGTSASAPLAAGIVALVLEANSNLTWRDLQHIVVRTAKPGNLKDSSWTKNGVGRRVSHSFGYGLMDAAAMVEVARTWKTVPEQQRCEINAPHLDKMIPPKRYITLQLQVKHCMGVNFLEHVQAKITLTSQRRGDIQIYLKSPAGTKVTLLTSRIHDASRSGFNQWPFMSVHTWGEAPHGNWQLEIHNEGKYMGHAALKGWSLIFYGTAAPIDKNDPVSIRPTISTNNSSFSSPSSSLTHHQLYSPQYPLISPPNSNHYQISLLNKSNTKVNMATSNPGGNGGNRKQQQNHQLPPSYGVFVTSPKKNGKISKNNHSSGNKSNGKNSGGGGGGNNNNQKQLATSRPNFLSTSNQFGKGGSESRNNFYRISTSPSKSIANGNFKQSQMSATTQRPKLSQQSSYNINFGSGSTKFEKPSRIHEKIAIKAPKQVKENNAFSISGIAISTSSPISHQRYDNYERIQTQNPRIPKLFEQYEKIQQIFPEFHPYTGPKESQQISTGAASSTGLNIQAKPPPNKKQYPFYEPPGSINKSITGDGMRGEGFGFGESGRAISSSGSISSSTSGRSGTTGNGSGTVATNPKPSRENSKKLSQSYQNEEKDQQKERMYIPNRKNTKAQITQSDLILYGTSKPAQPDDQIKMEPGEYGSFGIDLEHNLLDFDPETASGQWRNMQQVGESNVDVQRTSSDVTNSSCIKFSPDQRCIECVPPTFNYDGRCYTSCPEQTYAAPEKPYNWEDNSESILSVRSVDLFNNLSDILSQERAIMVQQLPQKICNTCHQSCLKCHGSQESQCTACQSDIKLRIISSKESYCIPDKESDKLSGNNLSRATNVLSGDKSKNHDANDDDDDIGIGNDLYMFLIIIVPAITLIILIVALSILGKKLIFPCNRNEGYTYDRIAFDPPNEEAEILTGVEVGHSSSSTKPAKNVSSPVAPCLISSDSSDAEEG